MILMSDRTVLTSLPVKWLPYQMGECEHCYLQDTGVPGSIVLLTTISEPSAPTGPPSSSDSPNQYKFHHFDSIFTEVYLSCSTMLILEPHFSVFGKFCQ